MNFKSLPKGDQYPEKFNVIVEIPKGAHNKYEYDADLGVMKLDRVLFSPMFYPVDYGFIPGTHAGDGDPADVLILTDSPVFPGCLVEARPIGYLKMSDEAGTDEKILAVACKNPAYKEIQELEDIDAHTRAAISHFFEVYKTLEKKEVKVEGWHSKAEALELLKSYPQD